MKTLVVGASGVTGKLLVEQLLLSEQKVKVIVRSSGKIPDSWNNDENISVIRAGISEMSIEEMAGHLKDCQAAVSCLGHNLSFKGIYGKPRKLVTDAVRLLCNAIEKNAPQQAIKIVLMNTAGNRNRDLEEPISMGEKLVVGLLRLLLPPHPDNEKAADVLRVAVGQAHQSIEWVAVRPDDLIDKDKVSEYELYQFNY